ncbi:hypothetical protein E5F05_06865 [Deinococcus metallilatus]|uniref:ATP-binding protein n=1 Tax=Deinococcus metallilatus TaxID=1211322 RepID=A0AAJ5K0V6_9DEIO|nr:ATP-binding protein [Deinococcus metallilatus]MBB5294667.1 hypothetical protein [Deinococcus metallilatus]QBY07702.1 hypothetical protein E5F05_06865 [Deinococcus metallilatus]RXJ14118.1 hypothetical protein ERJ73_05700 [Deinococcus metallilatus]TLK30083.1 hypothetical protein FCS05_06015 [Deinococcus metallilatus]GMA15883.1 ATPase [Deinococcus metallilatus]
MTREVEIPPHPAGTLVALAGGGYTPHAAVADLIDNAIGGGAQTIRIHLDISDGGVLVIEDDGRGMTEEALTEAMRVSTGWGTERTAMDLGRFGTGMKAAALYLSGVGRFTVISAPGDGEGAAATMDLRRMEQQGRWVIEVERRAGLRRGSRVEIAGPVLPHTEGEASAALMALSGHLRTTFAEHLGRGLVIRLQGRPLTPWRLCSDDLPGVSRLSTRTMDAGRVRVTAFILPTHTDDPLIEGPLGRREHAGFHVHRSGRAITSGGWLGLNPGRRNAVARDRVRLLVEIGPELDEEWRVTLPKSGCTLPQRLRPRFRKLLDEVLLRAGRQRAVRSDVGGRRVRPGGDLWDGRGHILRDHPLVQKVLASSLDVHAVEQLLVTLEGEHRND